MEQYIIRETTHENDFKEGYVIKAKNLSSAKRIASRNQFFQGTVLKISLWVNQDSADLENSNKNIIAIKKNKWIDF